MPRLRKKEEVLENQRRFADGGCGRSIEKRTILWLELARPATSNH